jgi:hypothetical protein
MDSSLIHADIFFVISSIGFCITFILLAVALGYVIHFLRVMTSLGRKIEEDAGVITEEARAFIVELKESALFRFLFGKKRTSSRKKL